MKKLLLAAVAVVATPLIAQTMQMPAPAPIVSAAGAAHPEMRSWVQARTDVVARTQRGFAMLDVNRDGVLDQTELASAGKRWDGAKGGMNGAGGMARMPMDRNAMFDMIDTDHNGAISRDEFARAPMPHGGGMGRKHMGMRMGMGGGGGMARMWTMADVNHDGRVTLLEATTVALQHFDRLDTNHDGQLTPQERSAGRAMMHHMRGQ